MLLRACLVLLVAGAGGCGPAVFSCQDDAACEFPGAVCERTGYCSFPDEECASGRRYGDLAKRPYANACVPEGDGADSSPSGDEGATTAGDGTGHSGGTTTTDVPDPSDSASDGSTSSPVGPGDTTNSTDGGTGGDTGGEGSTSGDGGSEGGRTTGVTEPCQRIIIDDFEDGSLDTNLWYEFGTNEISRSESEGSIRFTLPTAADRYGGIGTHDPIDVSGGSIELHYDQLPALDAHQGIFIVRHGNGDELRSMVQGSELRLTVDATGSGGDASMQYDPAELRILRIRFEDGRVYWERSADGTNFVPLHDVPAPFTAEAVDLVLIAGAWTSSGQAEEFSADSIEICVPQ